MNTRTIEICEKNFDLVVEVKEDGSVVEAQIVVAHMEDNPTDILKAVLGSKYYLKRIEAEFVLLDWNDHGGEEREEIQDGVSLLKECLRPA